MCITQLCEMRRSTVDLEPPCVNWLTHHCLHAVCIVFMSPRPLLITVKAMIPLRLQVYYPEREKKYLKTGSVKIVFVVKVCIIHIFVEMAVELRTG